MGGPRRYRTTFTATAGVTVPVTLRREKITLTPAITPTAELRLYSTAGATAMGSRAPERAPVGFRTRPPQEMDRPHLVLHDGFAQRHVERVLESLI